MSTAFSTEYNGLSFDYSWRPNNADRCWQRSYQFPGNEITLSVVDLVYFLVVSTDFQLLLVCLLALHRLTN